MAGGLDGSPSDAGLGVEHNAAGSTDDADGKNAEMRLGNGRRAALGPPWSPIEGNVVSAIIDGVLWVSW